MSLFQNSVSFEKGFRKTGILAGFLCKSKVAFSKTEVLKKPQLFHFLKAAYLTHLLIILYGFTSLQKRRSGTSNPPGHF
jgi:hypothetical protein